MILNSEVSLSYRALLYFVFIALFGDFLMEQPIKLGHRLTRISEGSLSLADSTQQRSL